MACQKLKQTIPNHRFFLYYDDQKENWKRRLTRLAEPLSPS